LCLPLVCAASVDSRLTIVEDVIVHPRCRRRRGGTAMVLALVDVAQQLLHGIRVVVNSKPSRSR
jgi:N-acetylglutamate synthase-like GNAT family acetyltransferase